MNYSPPPYRRHRGLPPSWADLLIAAIAGAVVTMVVLALLGRLVW